MLDRRNQSHGSFPICESAYTFTLEDQSATRGCPISPPLFHGDALCHSPSVASVQFKVLMFVWVKMLVSYSFQLVRPSCELTCTPSVRQRSAENTEKKKEKKNISVAEEKASIWVGSREEVNRGLFVVPHAFSLRNLSKSMSFHVKAITD